MNNLRITTLLTIIIFLSQLNIVYAEHTGLCFSMECISPGTQYFQSYPNGDDYTCSGNPYGLGAFGYATKIFDDPKNRVDLKLQMYPIYVDGRILHGWYHISVDLSDLEEKVSQWETLVLMSYGSHNTKENLYPVGKFTLELQDFCQEGKDSDNHSLQLVSCFATAANQVEHSNTFIFNKKFNNQAAITKKKFKVNWKMPPQYSCDPIQFINIRIGIGIPKVGDISYGAIYYTSVMLTLDTNEIYGTPDPKPVFPGSQRITCMENGKELRKLDAETKKKLKIKEVDFTYDPNKSRMEHCQPSKSEATKQKIWASTMGGRCADEETGLKETLTNPPGPNVPLKCVNPTEATAYTKLPTIEEYIEDTRYDLCNCLDREPDPGLVEVITDLPPPTAEPEYDADPPFNESIEARASAVNPNVIINPIMAHYKKSVIEWRFYVWKSRFTHASLAVVVFFFFIPVSIFYSRYLKEFCNEKTFSHYDLFYVVHLILVALGLTFLCMSLAAALAGAVYAGRYNFPIHAFMGYGIIALYTLCFLLGPFRSVNCLLASIWIHVILGAIVYIGGLLSIITAGFITLDWSSKTLIDNFNGLIVTIVFVLVRLVSDIAFHIFMSMYARKSDYELELDKKRMIFPTIAKTEDVGTPPGTKVRVGLFIIYTVLSASLTFGLIYAMRAISLASLADPERGEEVLFENREKFTAALSYHGLH